VTAALRSPPARYLGLLVGLLALVALVLDLRSQAMSGADVLRGQSWGRLLAGLGAFVVFQLLAAASLRALIGRSALRMWASSQLVKYLPVPGSAVLGMVGSGVRAGMEPRAALRITFQHSLVLAGAAAVVGAVAVRDVVAARLPGLGPLPVVAAFAAVGVGVLVGLTSARSGTSRAAVTLLLGVVAWSILGVGLWASTALGEGSALLVGSSFALAWLVGLLALPVPAGIGIREAVLVALLTPTLGPDAAIAFSLVTRLLQVASDVLLAAVVLPAGPWRRAATWKQQAAARRDRVR